MTVSVILTTYNGASRGYIEKAINSVLSQNFNDFELIIIDDGSTDQTRALCEKFLKYQNVQYIYQKNKGISAARNKGILKSKGEFICFLDDDDLWMPNKLEEQVAIFHKHDDNLGLIFTWLDLIDENDNYIATTGNNVKGNIYRELFYGNLISSTSSVMIKREVFDKVGLFKEYMKSAEDFDLWFRISKKFNVQSINNALIKYRIHTNSLSNNNEIMEIYGYYAINNALINAPKEIRNQKNKILYRFYKGQSRKNFRNKDIINFRRCYRISKAYSKPDLIQRILFFLSYFPIIPNKIADYYARNLETIYNSKWFNKKNDHIDFAFRF